MSWYLCRGGCKLSTQRTHICPFARVLGSRSKYGNWTTMFHLFSLELKYCKHDVKQQPKPKLFTACSMRYIAMFWKNIDVCETLMPPFPNMNFDLDLWPTDLKINRDHLLIKDYLPTKFEASGAKPSWVISCTRLRATDIPTDRPTGATQHAPPFSKGGIKIFDFRCIWILVSLSILR